MDYKASAARILNSYFRQVFGRDSWNWENEQEMEAVVEFIVRAAKEEIRREEPKRAKDRSDYDPAPWSMPLGGEE